MLVSFSARFSECAFRFISLFGVCVSVFLAILDILVPASFNLFCCPVHVCPVFCFVLYCVCRGGGSIPPVSFCTGVLPRFAVCGTRL